MSYSSIPTKAHSLDFWLSYLNQLHHKEIDLGLERIQVLASELQLTHFPCPVISVAGTNGKGSCVRLLEAIYLAAGFRVAAYTSPHILRFNERLRINGEDSKDQLWINAFCTIEEKRGSTNLSFFEYTTLAALLICKRSTLDLVILEVGLGGRLDAVNVVDADLAIISAIDLDHTEYLGNTRESIALEKAGIFKTGKLAICGDIDIPLAVFEQAEKVGVSLFCFNRDFFCQTYPHGWTWTGQKRSYFHLPYPKLKLQNAVTTLMAIELLMQRLPVTKGAIKEALQQASLPGRFERIDTPLAPIYLDVAHNPHAIQCLVENLATIEKTDETRTLAVFGMLKDKDIQQVIELMLPEIQLWYVAELETERAAKAADIVKLIGAQGQKSCYTFPSVAAALRAALQACKPSDRIVVFGSFYTVAGAKEYLIQLQGIEEEQHQIKQRFKVTPQIKHRIIGLLVLLGLLALFLPLLFSTSQPVDGVDKLKREIPAAPALPEVKMQLSEPQTTPIAETSVQVNSPETLATDVSSVLPASAETAPVSSTEIATASSSATSSTSTPAVTAADSSVATAPLSAPAPASTPAVVPSSASAAAPVSVSAAAPALAPTSAPTAVMPVASNKAKVSVSSQLVKSPGKVLSSGSTSSAWTIQLGSYANTSAAQTLVKKLRNRGFNAYTRIAIVNDKQVTRVFVGPEINQAKVQQMQKQLENEFKLSGVILKYSVS